jgi:Ser/Thr protein kinase RdoA (MazF antagonist)
MGKELVQAHWPPLTDDEVRTVLAHWDGPADAPATKDAEVTWRSPRPMSAAALVRWRGGTVFVKRHHERARDVAQLGVEHAFAGYLRSRGLAVPAVLRTPAGATAVRSEGFVYEVHEAAKGIDAYRDTPSWLPFTSLGHAGSAGAELARFHQAAAGFALPARPPGVLMSSCAIITAPDPLAAVGDLVQQRPGLARSVSAYRWQDDFARHLLPAVRGAAPFICELGSQWGHGDWHPSNLIWSSAGPDAAVTTVLDLGLANRTSAVHDLATAIERSAVNWLDLAESGVAEADLDAIDALLCGYESVMPLSAPQILALADILPIVHLEYALSEVEYFADVVSSPLNADLAYHTYLLGHAQWFEGEDGTRLLDHLRRRGRREPRLTRSAPAARSTWSPSSSEHLEG